MTAFVDMGDDSHIENHVSPLCKMGGEVMRSEFEKWLGYVWLSDAEWDESKNTYSDSRIHCMWSAWQHQQSKVDELTKQRDSFIKAYQIEMDESVELQKRVDAVKALIEEYRDPPTEDKTFQHALSIVADELEQALKGGSDE
jgi:hypothetical protein